MWCTDISIMRLIKAIIEWIKNDSNGGPGYGHYVS